MQNVWFVHTKRKIKNARNSKYRERIHFDVHLLPFFSLLHLTEAQFPFVLEAFTFRFWHTVCSVCFLHLLFLSAPLFFLSRLFSLHNIFPFAILLLNDSRGVFRCWRNLSAAFYILNTACDACQMWLKIDDATTHNSRALFWTVVAIAR